MERWNILLGKCLKEANEMIRNLGYFVVEEGEQVLYQNVIVVRLKDGKIVKVLRAGN